LGRIVGIECFMSEEADNDDRDDRRQIANIKKNCAAEQNTERTSLVLPGHDVQPINDVAQRINAIQHQAVKRLQSSFQGRMIRRTVASKNFEGESIIPLKPYVHVDAIVRLQDWEHQVILEIANRASEG
jgi:hypothetical protein